MTRTSTAKAKGRTGQQEIRDALLATFPELTQDDIRSTTMGDTGEDIKLSTAARKLIPASIEVKRRKSGLKTIYDWMTQASKHGTDPPAVFFRADRSPWLVVVDLNTYLELLRGKT